MQVFLSSPHLVGGAHPERPKNLTWNFIKSIWWMFPVATLVVVSAFIISIYLGQN